KFHGCGVPAMKVEASSLEVVVPVSYGNVTGKKKEKREKSVRYWFIKGRTRSFSDRACKRIRVRFDKPIETIDLVSSDDDDSMDAPGDTATL
ncbi:hypothetical protein Dimus_005386, partial [Dionaea muscipula]